jgi:hypothetical protein
MSRWRTRNATQVDDSRPTNRCRTEEPKTPKRRIKLHPAQKNWLSRGSFSNSSGGIPSCQYEVVATCKSSAPFTCTPHTPRSDPRSRSHTSPLLKRGGTHKYVPTPPSDPPRVTDHPQRTPDLERPWVRNKQGRLLLREIHRRLKRLAFGRLAFGRRYYCIGQSRVAGFAEDSGAFADKACYF